MPHATQPPETDLVMPLPAEGEQWDPHTIHTHYFGASVPEAKIGCFFYIRYQPTFPLSQGGVAIFSGTDNVELLDIDFLDYEVTMPWPTIEGNTITTDNGLKIEFTEPGKAAHITYESRDGKTTVDVTQTAISPLLVRGHVMPGEEDTDPAQAPGGSEQFMHCTGELTVNGDSHKVDCLAARDRSWRQVRTEAQGAVPTPPVGWSPMCFGEDLIFNQISIEAADTDPAWTGLYDWPADKPEHHFAWLFTGEETLDITKVRRNVLERHPLHHMAMRQEIEATDENGKVHRFEGEAIAAAPMPAWPNTSFHDSVYRWTDESGREAHCTYQELWFDIYQRAMIAKRGAAV